MYFSPAVRDVIERAQQLPIEDQQAIIRVLTESLSRKPDSAEEPAPDYSGWLALSGKFHSDYTDVARNKGKHLAEVYYGRRAPDERSPD